MKKTKNLFIAACTVLTLSVLLILVLWFSPFFRNNPISPQIILYSNNKSNQNAIIPILKNSNKPFGITEDKHELITFLSSSEKDKNIIIDGAFNIDIIDAINNCKKPLNIILLNSFSASSENLKLKPKTNLLILSEVGGALKRDKNAIFIFNTLSNSSIESNGRPVHTNKKNISLNIYPAPMISVGTLPKEALNSIYLFLSEKNNGNIPFSVQLPNVKLALSVLSVISLFVILIILAVKYDYPHEFAEGIVAAEIKNNHLFFFSRGLLLIVSLITSFFVFVVLGIFDCLHRGGILFISYFIGCSLTTMLFYKYGMLGIKGKPLDIKPPFSFRSIILSLGVVATVLTTGLSLGAGGFWALKFNGILNHIMTVLVFLLLSFGFISIMQDYVLLKKAVNKEETALMLLLFPYIPVFAIAAIYIPLGEFYLTMSVLKLVVFAVICIVSSKIIRDITGSVLISAMSGAFCLSFFTCYQIYI